MFLRKLYNKLLKFQLINSFKDNVKGYLLDFRSLYYLKRSHKKHAKNGIVKVAFIVQMPEVWDKEVDVYNEMISRKEFQVTMIVVPPFDFVNWQVEKEYGSNYFLNNYPNAVKALNDDGNFIDLKNFEFDYVFYQRPYEHYLPKELRSSRLVKFTKCCYIPYATTELKGTTIYPKDFFRNVYFGFLEDSGAVELNNARFFNRRYQSFCNIGYPIFEYYLNSKYKSNYLSVLWTPRWTYDPVAGGSHFMEYYRELSEYPWNDKSFIIRPHQLMWDNFKREGIISQGDIIEIKKKWELNGIIEDKNERIEDTFRDVDIMISDKSSVIPMFFLTGKPIIYCPFCPDGYEYSDLFSSILPGMYIANDWKELKLHLDKLLLGEDQLFEKRQSIIQTCFSQHVNATNNILECIINDSKT